MLQDHDPYSTALDEITDHMVILASLFPELEHLELDESTQYSAQPEHEPNCPYVQALKLRTSEIFAGIKTLQSLRWSDGETFHRSSETIVSQGVQLRRPSRYFPLHLDV